MVFRYIKNYISGLGSNEYLINKLSEARIVKRAAQITAYTTVRILDTFKKRLVQFQKEGGHEKLKEVGKNDLKEGTKIVKEMITYDIPETIKKMFKEFNPRRRRNN